MHEESSKNQNPRTKKSSLGIWFLVLGISFGMLLALGLLAAGCGSSAEDAEREQGFSGLSENGDDQSAAQGPARSDWPQFLGPFGKSISAEKGILAPWPDRGLQVIWQKPIGVGYGMPAISQGRLFQFDRHGDQARLSCLTSETGEFLWNFEYPTDYHDYYGFNNGPRSCPVVDGDRVYIYGAEGMLHCVRGTDGQVLWKVDTRADFHVVQNHFGVGSAPVIEGDLLIVQVGGSHSGVVAFHKLDVGRIERELLRRVPWLSSLPAGCRREDGTRADQEDAPRHEHRPHGRLAQPFGRGFVAQ